MERRASWSYHVRDVHVDILDLDPRILTRNERVLLKIRLPDAKLVLVLQPERPCAVSKPVAAIVKPEPGDIPPVDPRTSEGFGLGSRARRDIPQPFLILDAQEILKEVSPLG